MSYGTLAADSVFALHATELLGSQDLFTALRHSAACTLCSAAENRTGPKQLAAQGLLATDRSPWRTHAGRSLAFDLESLLAAYSWPTPLTRRLTNHINLAAKQRGRRATLGTLHQREQPCLSGA